MAAPKPIPLYPIYAELKEVQLEEFPELFQYFKGEDPWKIQTWKWGQDFLSYIGRNKSEHTYTRFRSEVEKFLLWAFLIKNTPIDEFRKKDILEYADFCWQPPLSWICLTNHEKFLLQNGLFVQNLDWAPFRLMLAKGDQSKPDKKKYRPSQQTLHSTLMRLTLFINT